MATPADQRERMGNTDSPGWGRLKIVRNRLAVAVDAGMAHGTEGGGVVLILGLGAAEGARATGTGLITVPGIDGHGADIALVGLALRIEVTEGPRLAALAGRWLVARLALLVAALGGGILGLEQRAPGHRGQGPGNQAAHG